MKESSGLFGPTSFRLDKWPELESYGATADDDGVVWLHPSDVMDAPYGDDRLDAYEAEVIADENTQAVDRMLNESIEMGNYMIGEGDD